MKFKFIFLFLILVPFINQAANETQVESNISEVNVYRQRAQITRKAKAKVQRGDNLIVFSGLSGSLLKNSITVSGNGDGIIQSVTHRVNYLNRTAKPPRMLLLEDSLEWITQEMQVLTDEKFVLTSEQNLILGNNKIGGTAEGLTTEELQKLANFYKSRLAEIMKGIRSILLKEKVLKERQNAYTAEIQQIRARRDQPTQEVVVAFNAKSAGSIELTLKYLVNGAQWNPFYDIRVANTKDPIQFFLKANVVNNTGIDWNQV
ncbi:MAG: mucoidy inhibitor MuiA family protein, partial [Bacteroidetes bacterium]|nr:mucoidy inhibitor MuiA family protein [Bacteroidota bacterium]